MKSTCFLDKIHHFPTEAVEDLPAAVGTAGCRPLSLVPWGQERPERPFGTVMGTKAPTRIGVNDWICGYIWVNCIKLSYLVRGSSQKGAVHEILGSEI